MTRTEADTQLDAIVATLRRRGLRLGLRLHPERDFTWSVRPLGRPEDRRDRLDLPAGFDPLSTIYDLSDTLTRRGIL